jgi:putative addiction module component (TIGR02574 family)
MPSDEIDADSAEPPLSEAQRRELDRRLAADAADPTLEEPWEDLKQKLLNGDF